MTVTNSEEIANRFCNYFADVGPNLASKIIPVFKSSNECLAVVSSSPLQNFDPVRINELAEVVENF